MILADTSIWTDHLRLGNKEMRRHLDQGQIVIHPFIIAELALGSLKERTKTLALLDLSTASADGTIERTAADD